MKHLFILFLFASNLCPAQNNGITYQAVIYNPNGEELPGADNPLALLTNKDICLRFGIIDASGNIEYQEEVKVTTDAFGMVNLLIGSNTQTGGYAVNFAGIEWSADAKFLKVDLDIKGNCLDFEELSNQPFTYVPFAYYSPASDIPGPAGADGINGATGPVGPIGAVGADGINGATGPIGPVGADGINGATGPIGPVGADGIDGGDGLSAYEVWIRLGNTGAEQEFIDSLKGPQGDEGFIAGADNIGDIVYWNSSDWVILPIGSEGDVLTVSSGLPFWQQPTSQATPSNLVIGSLWGGGVVIYIAQPGDEIYVEDETHGLIAPLNWINPGGGTNPLSTLEYADGQYYQNNASADIGFGKSNTELYMSFLNQSYPNIATSFTHIAFVYCDQLVMNGYDDWFLPNLTEYGKFWGLESNLDIASEASVLDYASDIDSNAYKGSYAHSGYRHSRLGIIIPGNYFFNMNCCLGGWEKFVPMRYF